MISTLSPRVAVCSWSLQPAGAHDLVAKLEATGIRRVQLALDPLRELSTPWANAPALLRQHGFTIVSGMFGCIGEDYSTLDTIRRTGGIAPDQTWENNLLNIKKTASLARDLGLELVTFHAGFVPQDEADPAFAKMVDRLRKVADIFASDHVLLGLETGQETATALLHLLGKLDRTNVVVNFDPANMLLYDKGNPLEALRALGPWIKQVHIKDAVRTKQPGTWGEEVPAGTGQVDLRSFFRILDELKFSGDFVIEREAGSRRVEDIRHAREMIERITV
ncbi:MAG TPA: sugar phosphate isomerase/epimerase family protein [Verrucomicrobiae bacterium]|nr:sugar phosphate isomerase/epimerase family protein [Verrucomicrobiae bacterium]